ncbi:ATP-binding cassette sub-family C member 10 [Anabrus simplex]|uniref:ATP-binding cassette sub-family C member 10 n=1 Tax=Anabrus simplex TaxID=316456 RepID=UPI0035A2953F
MQRYIIMEKEIDSDELWHWDWKVMCGPDGFKLWSGKEHNLGLCFQELCLRMPVLVLLSLVSAYYCGRKSSYVVRNEQRVWYLFFRKLATSMLAAIPVIRICVAISTVPSSLYAVDYLVSVAECFTWSVHLCYIFTMKHHLVSHQRGSVFIYILWILTFVMEVISLRTYYTSYRSLPDSAAQYMAILYGCSISAVVFQSIYAITLLSSGMHGDSEAYHDASLQSSERQSLLGSPRVNSYSRFREERDPLYLGMAMEGVSFTSKLFFFWVSPLMEKGMKRKLEQPDDLYDLPINLTPPYLCNQLEQAMGSFRKRRYREDRKVEWYGSINGSTGEQDVPDVTYRTKEYSRPVSLLRALHSCFGAQFYGIGILKLIADIAGFFGPILLHRLVTFIETKSEAIQDGYMYASGLFAVSLIAAFCNAHFSFLMAEVGLKLRGALVSLIYRKTLLASSKALNTFNTGEIVNFMSTDTDRIVNSCPSFHAFWSIPFQIAVTLYLLYNQVGIAFLAGVGFTVVLIPINKCLASKIGELSTKMMTCKDQRVQMMTEILRGIRALKVHVWEEYFVRKVSELRNAELKYLKGRKYLDALCVYFWATTPVLISILTFSTYVLLGNRLTAATVFTSIALLNMLIAPLNAFPWVLNGLTEAWVSLKRIQKLLELPDLDLTAYYTPLHPDSQDLTILVKEGSFSWDGAASLSESPTREQNPGGEERISRQVFMLQGINFIVLRGQLVGVTGRVGCGKSTLLAALLAELERLAGVVSIADLDTGFGFVTQQPWLQRGTLKDNILFGKSYDANKYRAVLEACCLDEDIQELPEGDQVAVGEGGVTLSGGQKARVALARAVYQDKDIYFMDDILSAVDSHVARAIYKRCINGLLKRKTRILCTHHVKYLMTADHVLVMDNGVIAQQGKPNEVLPEYDELISSSEFDGDMKIAKVTTDEKIVQEVLHEEITKDVMGEEEREVGSVHWNVYASYWRAVGHLLSAAILLSLLLMQTSRNLTDWWLSYWVSHAPVNESTVKNESDYFQLYGNSTPANSTDDMVYYLTVYGILAGSNTIFTLFRAFLFAYGGIHAATSIHRLLLKKVIKGKIIFFDITPLGRILNRFSSDTYTVDDSLPFIMNILLAQFFGVLGTLVVTIYGLPWLILVLAPLVPVYTWLQNHYRLTSRELKRLTSVTLSPVYSHFNETLLGIPTIRAFRAVPRFKRENEEYLEANQKCQFASQAAAQWLGLRLQFIGVAMVTGVGVIAVLQHQFDVADPGLIGLALSYALSVTGMLGGLVSAFTETEKEMIAVERVCQYIDLVEPETNEEILSPPYAWPSQGVIVFNNVVLKYRDYLAPSLRGVSFETRPAEKIGIMGRTGAGKSSLIVALFRLVEITSGEIFIDAVNIAHISLRSLRSRLAVIPQDPFLFSGTIRENLDPGMEFRDAELIGALQRCHLVSTIRKLGGLDAKLEPGGRNLSVGQRQLLCLVRAVLHNAKIVCIDEATANVDMETDRNIQHTLRTSFRHSTVLSIAHRASTVMDLDRVLVMGDGEVLEFDNPDVLMRNHNSHFYKLASPEYEMS